MHGLLVYTMRVRQVTDLSTTEQLRDQSAAFETAYFGHAVEVQAD
jgi:hypothetical protein